MTLNQLIHKLQSIDFTVYGNKHILIELFHQKENGKFHSSLLYNIEEVIMDSKDIKLFGGWI